MNEGVISVFGSPSRSKSNEKTTNVFSYCKSNVKWGRKQWFVRKKRHTDKCFIKIYKWSFNIAMQFLLLLICVLRFGQTNKYLSQQVSLSYIIVNYRFCVVIFVNFFLQRSNSVTQTLLEKDLFCSKLLFGLKVDEKTLL